MAKRMRLPNGFGQISKLKTKRLRKPFRAMVTIGWTLEGKPIRKTVGYYENYNDAYTALVKYHEDPDKRLKESSFEDIYNIWSEEYFKTIEKTSTKKYVMAFKKCEDLHEMPMKDIKAIHIKNILETDMAPSTKSSVKNLLNIMFDYALQYDIVNKNYARLSTVKIENTEHTHHIPYSDDEIEILWNHMDNKIVRIILIQCYSGFRPKELLNISIEDDCFIGGSKTEAGRNRIVPIHEKIKAIVKTTIPTNISYMQWYNGLRSLCKKLDLDPEHKPHDGRVTFATKLKEVGADEYAIKLMMGHTITDITESVYTHRSVDWLREQISLID